jgi:phosphoribosylformylglycinamidine synthase
MNDALLKLLSSGNIASKAWIYRQYDYMVRTDTVVGPGSDAAIVRIKGEDNALAMTVDCNSRYCFLDPYTGAALAVAEAARNLVVSGASPLALTDCLNFGNPERPEVMWQIKEAIRGISDACRAFDIPVIGGNVSLYNETSGAAVHPTPTIGMVGLIDDLKRNTTQWFKDAGDVVMLMGAWNPSLGGSEYLSVMHGLEKGMPPRLDLDAEKRLQEACLAAIKAGIIKSAHDLSEGGLAVALAECCFNPRPQVPVGAAIEIKRGGRIDETLFGESGSSVIVSVDRAHIDELKRLCSDVPCEVIGKVHGDSLKIGDYINCPVSMLMHEWSGSLERYLTHV